MFNYKSSEYFMVAALCMACRASELIPLPKPTMKEVYNFFDSFPSASNDAKFGVLHKKEFEDYLTLSTVNAPEMKTASERSKAIFGDKDTLDEEEFLQAITEMMPQNAKIDLDIVDDQGKSLSTEQRGRVAKTVMLGLVVGAVIVMNSGPVVVPVLTGIALVKLGALGAIFVGGLLSAISTAGHIASAWLLVQIPEVHAFIVQAYNKVAHPAARNIDAALPWLRTQCPEQCSKTGCVSYNGKCFEPYGPKVKQCWWGQRCSTIEEIIMAGGRWKSHKRRSL